MTGQQPIHDNVMMIDHAILRCAAVLWLLASLGCGDGDFRQEAQGLEGHVTVVMDSALWSGSVGHAVREQVGGLIVTLPSREPAFEIDPISLANRLALEYAQRRKNVLFVASLDDTSSTVTRTIRSFLTEEVLIGATGGGSVLVSGNDVWRKRQRVFYLVAATPESLAVGIEESGPYIIDQFNDIARLRLHREMFDIGRQPDLEHELMETHDFAVHMQHDYVIAADTSNFIWLRRVVNIDSWRSLFVYYEENIVDPNILSPEWVIRARDHLARRFMQGSEGGWVEVDRRRPVVVDSIDFKGRFAFEIRGLWHMVGEENGRKFPFGMGGPFLTYAFYDEATGRLFMVDGMVFAPNYPKREFLRQMEVIAYTFRTNADVSRSDDTKQAVDR